MKHIYDGSVPPVFEGMEESLLLSTGFLDNHNPNDAKYVWSVALNIKKHIGRLCSSHLSKDITILI
jgi:hypothetical protein